MSDNTNPTVELATVKVTAIDGSKHSIDLRAAGVTALDNARLATRTVKRNITDKDSTADMEAIAKAQRHAGLEARRQDVSAMRAALKTAKGADLNAMLRALCKGV